MEKLLEQSVNKLRKGTSLEQAVLSVPKENQEELKALLQTSLLLIKIPKLEAPAPALRRKYILEPVKQKFWASIFHISRFVAGSTAFMLLLAIFAVGGYTALQSTPGQALFSVKRTAENFRLKFVMSEASKAQLQLAYAESRYNEAVAILNNPQSSPKQEVAALQELSKQTQTATESVQQAAHSQPLDSASHPLVNKLENLAKQQTQLIAKTQGKTGDSEVKIAANNAADASVSASNQVSQIKKYLTIAESSQDPVSLVDLSSDPNSISVSGLIVKLDKTSISVEKLNFEITKDTEIKDLAGDKLELNALKNNLKIKISGKKDGNKLIAESIILLNLNDLDSGKVKGDSTTTQESTSTPIQTTTTPVSLKTEIKNTEQFSPPTQENPRLGNFIIEDPNPQYKP